MHGNRRHNVSRTPITTSISLQLTLSSWSDAGFIFRKTTLLGLSVPKPYQSKRSTGLAVWVLGEIPITFTVTVVCAELAQCSDRIRLFFGCCLQETNRALEALSCEIRLNYKNGAKVIRVLLTSSTNTSYQEREELWNWQKTPRKHQNHF